MADRNSKPRSGAEARHTADRSPITDPFDRWLARELRELYAHLLKEPLPASLRVPDRDDAERLEDGPSQGRSQS